jgi:isocitrate dehydrogenase
LRENENRIVSELNTIQGGSINIGGYYKPNENLVNHAMRPSKVFNRILE